MSKEPTGGGDAEGKEAAETARLEAAARARQAEVDAAADAQEKVLTESQALIDGATDGKNWAKGAIVVAGPTDKIPAKSPRPIIVVQIRTREKATVAGEDADHKYQVEGETHISNRHTTLPALEKADYPEGADLYLRSGAEASFGDLGPVVTIGRDFQQAGFGGLSDRPGELHVGPASPVYAAVDLAHKNGAKKVEILGLEDAERESLAPWFAEIADRVDISFG